MVTGRLGRRLTIACPAFLRPWALSPALPAIKKRKESVDWKPLVVLAVDTDHSVIREAGSDPAPVNQKVCGRCPQKANNI